MKKKLASAILISMIVGALTGILLRGDAIIFEPIGIMFMQLLKMLIVPLVFTSLVVGILSLGSVKNLGKLGSRTFLYYMCSTTIAVMIGLVCVNFIQPGVDSYQIEILSNNYEKFLSSNNVEDFSVLSTVMNIVPSNIFKAIFNENMLGVIFFSIFIGYAFLSLENKSHKVASIIEELNSVFLKMTDWVMLLAPIGVFALVSSIVGQTGLNIFKPVALYVSTVIIALFLHLLITLIGSLVFITKYSPILFFKKIFPAIATAFSTDSSIATLPVTMDCLENEVGVSKKVVGFVAPLGATLNMDGTALYEAVAAVFIAQIFGIDMTLTEQIIIMLTASLASVGAAGIPSAGLVTMVIVLKSVNLPLEGIGILLPVDRILDMFRTTVNVISDSCGALLVGRIEGEVFNDEKV